MTPISTAAAGAAPTSLTALGTLAVVLLVVVMTAVRLYRKVPSGHVIVVSRVRDVRVLFHGGFVLPIVHRAEMMDITTKQVEVGFDGAAPLLSREGAAFDARAVFHVRVNPTAEDVVRVARALGTRAPADPAALRAAVTSTLTESLVTAARAFDADELRARSTRLRDEVVSRAEPRLGGFRVDDVVLEHLRPSRSDHAPPADPRP